MCLLLLHCGMKQGMFKVLSERWEEGDIDGQIMTMIKVALVVIAEIDAISAERQIKYRDRGRDRYNGYYLNKYRERLGNRYRYERGDRLRIIYKDEYKDRFSEMYRENDRKDCGKRNL